MSGKTTAAIKMLHKIRAATSRPLLVLDPNLDPRWEADFITDDPEKFKTFVFANKGCELAIDESGETIGRFAGDMMVLATRGRHWGHRCTFISQRAQQIDKNVRSQCTTLLCFSQYKDDAKILAAEFVDPEIEKAYLLKKGEYYLKRRFCDILKLNAFNE